MNPQRWIHTLSFCPIIDGLADSGTSPSTKTEKKKKFIESDYRLFKKLQLTVSHQNKQIYSTANIIVHQTEESMFTLLFKSDLYRSISRAWYFQTPKSLGFVQVCGLPKWFLSPVDFHLIRFFNAF